MEYSEEKHICDYCGEEAHYHFKNGKWCCNKSTSSCKAMKEKFSKSAIEQWNKLKQKGIKFKEDIPQNERVFKKDYLEHICYYCGAQNAQYQFKNGRWCCQDKVNKCPAIRKKNSQKNKIRQRSEEFKLKRKPRKAWNKGLTKETSKSILAHSNALKRKYKTGQLIAHNKGKKIWSEQDKKRISQHRKKYLNQHPQKVPYLLNHSSKISYPERYFKYVFKLENIDLKYHLQVGRYQLDFYNEDKKKYIQIDGQSHYLDKKTIKIDEERTQYLKQLGWECIRVRWKDYLKLSLDKRKEIVKDIKEFIK